MDRDAARAFADRDWSALEALAEEERRERYARLGSAGSVRISRALWAHVRAMRPDWPSAGDREDDLGSHVALKRKLDRASRAFAIR